MKKLLTLFAIIVLLAFVAFGQQATPLAPAQASAPTTAAPVRTTVAPVAARPARSATTATVQATPTAPAVAAPSSSPRATTQPKIASTTGATRSAQQPTVATSAPPAKEPDFISEKGFKGKVFEIKYREPSAVRQAVANLGSGFKGAQISYSDEFKTITIRDFPENIAAIEEAIKRLDTPQAPRPDIEFRIHVLIGSAMAIQGEEMPADLKEVVNQLQSALKYKNYSLMFSALHRTKEGAPGVGNNGVAEAKLFNTIAVPSGNQIFYDYSIGQIYVDSSTSAGTTVQIGQFGFSLRIPLVMGSSTDPKITYQNVGFRSPVSLREGEKVVVGTTTMGDKGLIVVLTAKVHK
ncbi:MAG: hypothetical protein HY231_14070 [Acidobacteria bacterium]|nr:hypothetical protein [Acidobacteriota bacterium]